MLNLKILYLPLIQVIERPSSSFCIGFAEALLIHWDTISDVVRFECIEEVLLNVEVGRNIWKVAL